MAYTFIAKVNSGASAQILFSAVPGTYKTLMFIIQARTQLNGNYDPINISLNTATTNHKWQRLSYSASTQTAGADTGGASIPFYSATSNYVDTKDFGSGTVTIPNYASSSNFKTGIARGGAIESSTYNSTGVTGFMKAADTTIDTVYFKTASNQNYSTNSVIYLYGIK